MADVKLVGNDILAWDGYFPANWFALSRHAAAKSGIVSAVRVQISGAGASIKVAIYADNGGEPGARLAYTTGSAVNSGENSISIEPINVVAGLYYWLAFNINTGNRMRLKDVTSPAITERYKSATYSTFTFPDPAGSGFTSDEDANAIAAWGEEAVAGSIVSLLVGGEYRRRR